MNISNINVQLLTIAAAVEKKKDLVYQAAMMDPHTASELDLDSITALCDELMAAHEQWLPVYTEGSW
jgi:alpha-galactosidase